MKQQPLALDAPGPTYTQLNRHRTELLVEHGPRLLREITKLLGQLEKETKLENMHTCLQRLNAAALTLSALDEYWVDFSNAVFEQVVLPSKTSATAAVREICTLFRERERTYLG